MNPIEFRSLRDEKDLKRLKEFLLTQAQQYPDFSKWVDGKCTYKLEQGIYIPIIAVADNKIIGNAIYQQLDSSKDEFEIKNFRIDKNYRQRDLGHFILTQVQYETKAKELHLDVSTNNISGVQFFIRNGFNIKASEHLYTNERKEFIMQKSNELSSLEKKIIQVQADNFDELENSIRKGYKIISYNALEKNKPSYTLIKN